MRMLSQTRVREMSLQNPRYLKLLGFFVPADLCPHPPLGPSIYLDSNPSIRTDLCSREVINFQQNNGVSRRVTKEAGLHEPGATPRTSTPSVPRTLHLGCLPTPHQTQSHSPAGIHVPPLQSAPQLALGSLFRHHSATKYNHTVRACVNFLVEQSNENCTNNARFIRM